MQDFTLTTYKRLLQKLATKGYSFQTLQDFIQQPEDKTVILRHDVDRLPGNAFVVAKIEEEAGIKASYYFRIVKESYDEDIIKQIAEMGHEIGYHYENLAEVSKKNPQITQIDADEGKKEFRDELFELAIGDFRLNLKKLRKLYPVKTICMHGSPLSKWDNRDLWEKYDYRDFGIIGDPYFDVDFNEVFYLTDTGRRWDGETVSVRDKVKADPSETLSGTPPELFHGAGEAQRWPRYHSTFEIIEAVDAGTFPDKVMMTVHPQRWHDRPLPWAKELIWQNIKNVVKKAMVQRLGR
jgi:hypothetical protein